MEKLASPERILQLLEEVELELSVITPEIEILEEQIKALNEMRQSRQRLLTLKLSLKALLDTDFELSSKQFTPQESDQYEMQLLTYEELCQQKSFVPDEAMLQIEKYLKQKSSLNYEMFKAIVYQGGCASTEEIKQFLIQHDVRQPQNGESFETIALTDISSRINYLVRKNIVKATERGRFYSLLGWL
jgi:hypothetical protein